MMPSGFDKTLLAHVAHRPWPLPDRPWVMTQSWHDLLFAHWPVDPAHLRPHVPPAFELDLLGGRAWIGVVAFHMSNVAPRSLPRLPYISAFAELNVRTYVRVGDRPGVYFFSLDAAQPLAVMTARLAYRLPYYTARMRITRRSAEQPPQLHYESRRRRGRRANFVASYRPTGPGTVSRPGSLEYFLTERYCLYAFGRSGRPYQLDIHHRPWLLHPAEARIAENTMAAASEIALPPVAPLTHYVERLDVLTWNPQPLG